MAGQEGKSALAALRERTSASKGSGQQQQQTRGGGHNSQTSQGPTQQARPSPQGQGRPFPPQGKPQSPPSDSGAQRGERAHGNHSRGSGDRPSSAPKQRPPHSSTPPGAQWKSHGHHPSGDNQGKLQSSPSGGRQDGPSSGGKPQSRPQGNQSQGRPQSPPTPRDRSQKDDGSRRESGSRDPRNQAHGKEDRTPSAEKSRPQPFAGPPGGKQENESPHTRRSPQQQQERHHQQHQEHQQTSGRSKQDAQQKRTETRREDKEKDKEDQGEDKKDFHERDHKASGAKKGSDYEVLVATLKRIQALHNPADVKTVINRKMGHMSVRNATLEQILTEVQNQELRFILRLVSSIPKEADRSQVLQPVKDLGGQTDLDSPAQKILGIAEEAVARAVSEEYGGVPPGRPSREEVKRSEEKGNESAVKRGADVDEKRKREGSKEVEEERERKSSRGTEDQRARGKPQAGSPREKGNAEERARQKEKEGGTQLEMDKYKEARDARKAAEQELEQANDRLKNLEKEYEQAKQEKEKKRKRYEEEKKREEDEMAKALKDAPQEKERLENELSRKQRFLQILDDKLQLALPGKETSEGEGFEKIPPKEEIERNRAKLVSSIETIQSEISAIRRMLSS